MAADWLNQEPNQQSGFRGAPSGMRFRADLGEAAPKQSVNLRIGDGNRAVNEVLFG
jgi:hypothetical protein